MREETDLFKALSEPNRVRIMMMLRERSLCVCEITAILELKTATVSSHLSMLREKGFILDEKRGKWIYYRIVEQPKNQMIKDILSKLPDWFAENDIIQSDLAKVREINKLKIVCS